MKLDPERVLAARDARGVGWEFSLPAVGAAIFGIVLVYWSTAASMAQIWARSETFAHGWLIAPISLALVWRLRHRLAQMTPALDALGFVLLAAAGAAWLVAAAGQVQVVQQYALTAMIPAAVLALAGRRVARAIAFPLAFLLLAVPAGEGLLPGLMEFTADFTVAALQLSGIPVYREGNFFAIPSGQWSVVEACSGLRYLIASFTVGAVFAYLTYHSFWKRAAFMALSIAVPILANGLRAYFIVLIGHFSDMKLAVGIDHFIYGWVFFGIVILLLFWLGARWRDEPSPVNFETPVLRSPSPSGRALAAGALGVLAVAAAWPVYAAYLEGTAEHTILKINAPEGAGGWAREAAPAGWRPEYQGAAASAFAHYRKDGRTVALYLARYRHQRQGAELVGSQNSIAGAESAGWLAVGEAARSEPLGPTRLELRQTRLRAGAQRLLVWDWYRVAGRDLSSPYVSKALLARDKLLGRGDDAAAVVIAAGYAERSDEAEEALRQFARAMLPSIHASLAGQAP